MAASDDWRVTISVSEPVQQPVSLRQAEHDIRRQPGRGIAVGAGNGQIFLYAGTEAAARDAGQIACDVLARYGIAAEPISHRWHPIRERRERPQIPPPVGRCRVPGRAAARGRRHYGDPRGGRSGVELGSHRQGVVLAR